MSENKTVKQRRVKVAMGYYASGYGRGLNNKTVYLIDGKHYVYYPKYARQAFKSLTGELEGYIPVNRANGSLGEFFYEVNPEEHK